MSKSGVIRNNGEYQSDYSQYMDTRMKLRAGGKIKAKRQNLWCLHGSAYAADLSPYFLNFEDPYGFGNGWLNDIAPTAIKICGTNLDTNGNLWTILADGSEIDITPTVDGTPFYVFNVGAQKFKSSFTAYTNTNGASSSKVFDGHAWWKLESEAPIEIVRKYTSIKAAYFLDKPVGYGAINDEILTAMLYCPDDSIPTYSKKFEIDFNGLISALEYTLGVRDNPGTWGVNGTCITHTRDAGTAAGVTLPKDNKIVPFENNLKNMP